MKSGGTIYMLEINVNIYSKILRYRLRKKQQNSMIHK